MHASYAAKMAGLRLVPIPYLGVSYSLFGGVSYRVHQNNFLSGEIRVILRVQDPHGAPRDP